MTPNSVKSANSGQPGRFVSQYDTSLIVAQLANAGSVAARWRRILSEAPYQDKDGSELDQALRKRMFDRLRAKNDWDRRVSADARYTPTELARRRQLYQIRKARRAAAVAA